MSAASVSVVFVQWGIDPKVIQIINSTHTNSWFKYADLQSCIVAKTGGRQGCKLGGLIFNSVYDIALHEVASALVESGVTTSFAHDPAEAFWNSRPSSACASEKLIDVTFVDDEAAVVFAKTLAELDAAIDILLSTYASVFAKFLLVINWAPGKTEGMLKYHGHGAKQHFDQRRIDGHVKI